MTFYASAAVRKTCSQRHVPSLGNAVLLWRCRLCTGKMVCTRALNFFRIRCRQLSDQAAVNYCMEEKRMSNELVCIAKLCEWFLILRTADIENLIDAVPAYDRGSAAFHARMILDAKASTERGNKTEELPYPDNWREHRIFSQEARLLAESIIRIPSHVYSLFDAFDEVLGKEIPIYHGEFTSFDKFKDKIEELARYDELLDEVYDTFLKLLSVNKIDAIRHITSNKYELNLEVPSDVKELIKKIEDETHASESSQHAADLIPPVALAQEAPLPRGGSSPQKGKKRATLEACNTVIGAIEQGYHLDKGVIGRGEFLEHVQETMRNFGTVDEYHATTAKEMFANSPILQRLRRKVGHKKQEKTIC